MSTPAVYRTGNVIGITEAHNLSPNDARILAAELLAAAYEAEPNNPADGAYSPWGTFTPAAEPPTLAVEIDTHPASPRPWSYDNQAAALPLVIGDSVVLEAVEWLIENQTDRAATVVRSMNGAQVHTAIDVGAALVRLALERMPGR